MTICTVLGQHSVPQLTSLQSWFVQSHACTVGKPRKPTMPRALATGTEISTVGRRQLLAGFAAMTAGASQVCKTVALVLICKQHMHYKLDIQRAFYGSV